jgi:HAD superfamily hydrolase (TIGR01509 family)
VRAILFDLDGTLIDSYFTWFHLTNHGCSAMGLPEVTEPEFRSRWGQSVAEDAATWFRGRPLAEVSRFYDAHYIEHVHHVQVDPDARDVLRILADQNVPTAIVTNTPQPLAGMITARLGLVARTVVGENDVPRAKPAPHMLWLAAARLGCPPASALMVGDSTYDQRAAHAAGVPFVQIKPTGAALPGARTITSLHEVVALAAAAASRPAFT